MVSNEEQALRIISKAITCLSAGHDHVYITYSANYDQTQMINSTYTSGNWHTFTNGANQAAVINAMEELLDEKYRNLQGKLKIAPVTTLTYSTFGGNTHKEVIEKDLQLIEEHLRKGDVVLGWMNQNTEPLYAIGGGIAQLPVDLNSLIQNKLMELARQYA